MYRSIAPLHLASVLLLSTNLALAQDIPPPTCPDSNGTTYVAPSGAQFLIECDVDHQAGDMDMTWVDSFEDCIVACDENPGCIDVSMSGSACYMKSTLGLPQPAIDIFGARILVASPTSTSLPSATAKPSISCPASDGTTYRSSTFARYTVECGIDHAAGDMGMQYVADLTACVELCDTTEDCVAVALSANACYLKSQIGRATPNQGLSGAVLAIPRPACPNTEETWTAENGLVFALECDIDHPGGDLTSASMQSGPTGDGWFGECMELCSKTPGCIDISLSGAGCYLKDTLSPATTAVGIFGAKLLNASTPVPSSKSSPKPSVTPVSPVDVAAFEYLYCSNDSVADRVLSAGWLYGTDENLLTAEKCADFCTGYNYFGLEYSWECYCGNTLENNSVNKPGACDLPCSGNSSQLCGGRNALSLYRASNFNLPASPAPSNITVSTIFVSPVPLSTASSTATIPLYTAPVDTVSFSTISSTNTVPLNTAPLSTASINPFLSTAAPLLTAPINTTPSNTIALSTAPLNTAPLSTATGTLSNSTGPGNATAARFAMRGRRARPVRKTWSPFLA